MAAILPIAIGDALQSAQSLMTTYTIHSHTTKLKSKEHLPYRLLYWATFYHMADEDDNINFVKELLKRGVSPFIPTRKNK